MVPTTQIESDPLPGERFVRARNFSDLKIARSKSAIAKRFHACTPNEISPNLTVAFPVLGKRHEKHDQTKWHQEHAKSKNRPLESTKDQTRKSPSEPRRQKSRPNGFRRDTFRLLKHCLLLLKSGGSDDWYFLYPANPLSQRYTKNSSLGFVDGHAKSASPGEAAAKGYAHAGRI